MGSVLQSHGAVQVDTGDTNFASDIWMADSGFPLGESQVSSAPIRFVPNHICLQLMCCAKVSALHWKVTLAVPYTS